MRLFLAIHLSDAAIDHLRKVAAVLRPIVPDVSFTRDVNLHLTVRFLGETPENKLDQLREAVRSAVAGGGGLTLAATQMLFFPPSGGARIIAARVGGAGADQLMLMQSAMERAILGLGYKAEPKKYVPHVTLARADRGPVPPPAISKLTGAASKMWPGPTFEARHVWLMQSEQTPAGSKYRTVSQFDMFD